jgi:hypothetical protein
LIARLEKTVLSEKMIEDDLSRVEESATKSTYRLSVGFESVGTLRTGYPRVQAPSQDKRQGRRACRRVPAAPVPASRLRAAACHHGSGYLLPARGSSEAAMCLEDRLYTLQAIK